MERTDLIQALNNALVDSLMEESQFENALAIFKQLEHAFNSDMSPQEKHLLEETQALLERILSTASDEMARTKQELLSLEYKKSATKLYYQASEIE